LIHLECLAGNSYSSDGLLGQSIEFKNRDSGVIGGTKFSFTASKDGMVTLKIQDSEVGELKYVLSSDGTALVTYDPLESRTWTLRKD